VNLLSRPRFALNGRAGTLGKYQELEALQVDGVPVPDFKRELVEADFADGPWLARRTDHKGGVDIRPVLQYEEAAWRRAAGWDFFTKYLNVKREFRAWVFRDKYLGTYEKVMVRPQDYQRYGRGNKQGFAFQLLPRDQVPQAWRDTAKKAVAAVGLDFGAVDMVSYAPPSRGGASTQEQLAVLEVNSAPGAASGTRQCIRLLAGHIAEWYRGLR
jgi:hypothetical protein